jgi:hypothetical protein
LLDLTGLLGAERYFPDLDVTSTWFTAILEVHAQWNLGLTLPIR